MYIEIEEMKSVLYEYQMDEIVDNDDQGSQDYILEEGIASAVSEVRSYLLASNERRDVVAQTKQQRKAWKLYDVDAIFNKTGEERNPFLLRICKRVAAWNIIELASPDVVYDRVKENYDAAITTLEKIAGMGDYAESRLVLSDLPTIDEEDTSDSLNDPFRYVSRPKFRHE